LNQKIKQALIYPVSVLCVAIGMIITIMTYVIPKIEKIYQDSHVNLPELTLFIIRMSHFLRDYGIYMFFGFIVFMMVFAWVLRIPRFRYVFDQKILSLPIF
jgi:type II secretory pathway component PulF